MIDEAQIIDELDQLLVAIEQQIKEVNRRSEEMEISPYALQNADGSHPMGDLLIAKAQTLKTLLDYKMVVDDTVLHTEFGVLVEFPGEEERIIPCDRSLAGARERRDKINWDSTDATARLVYRQAGDWKTAKTEALSPVEDEIVEGIDYVTLTRENIPEIAAISGKSEDELWRLFYSAKARNTIVQMLKTNPRDWFDR